MNKYTIITHYTKDTPYKDVFEKYLLPSISKYNNLKLDVQAIQNEGDWYKNTSMKVKVILDYLNTHSCDVIYLDSDATIEQYPILFDSLPDIVDIAYHELSWNQWYGYNQPHDFKELLTGTMFLRNNEKIKSLCREWFDKSFSTNEWEQKVLQRIIKEHDLNIYQLPLEYCYMKSRPGNKEPLIKLEPVILHHQVSRELKRRRK